MDPSASDEHRQSDSSQQALPGQAAVLPSGRPFRLAFLTWNYPRGQSHDDVLRTLTGIVESPDNPVVCFYGQFESGSQTHREHCQMVARSNRPIRLTQWKAILGDSVAIFQCRDKNASVVYCSKESTRVPGAPLIRIGDLGIASQGHRSDIDSFKSAAATEPSFLQLMEDHSAFVSRSMRFAERYHQLHKGRMRVRQAYAKPNVYVYWGESRSGKSRRAFFEAIADYGPDNVFYKPADQRWFDGYDGQPCVIMDEDYGSMSVSQFLRLTDGYPTTVPVKGGTAVWMAKTVYITFNSHPRDWWKDLRASDKWDPEHDYAITARCTIVHHTRAAPWVPPEPYYAEPIGPERPPPPISPTVSVVSSRLVSEDEDDDNMSSFISDDPALHPVYNQSIDYQDPVNPYFNLEASESDLD